MAIQSLAIIIFVLAVFLVAGVPISYAIGISALAAILQMVTLDVSVLTAAQRTFVGMSKFSLTAIPFFVLAGNLMNAGKITEKIFDTAKELVAGSPAAWAMPTWWPASFSPACPAPPWPTPAL